MRASYGYATPSLAERDRRWSLVRVKMAEQGLDGLVLFGMPYNWDAATANARYLCPIGGNAEYNVVVFPAEGDPICMVAVSTMDGYWRIAQDWVDDVRPRKGTWARSIGDALRESGLASGRIGFDGLPNALDPDGWLPAAVFDELHQLLPEAELTNSEDLMEKVRCIKSPEELSILRTAAAMGDRMLAACGATAAPGVPEAVVYAAMRESMIADGGEEPTLLLWAADAAPFPHPFRVPSTRRLAQGDVIITEMHPRYQGYTTHVERTFSVAADPSREMEHIHEGCVAVFDAGLAAFNAGSSIVTAMKGVEDEMRSRSLDFIELGIHGHGLGSLEYPRFRHHASEVDTGAMGRIGDEFRPGMVFAFNIDLVDPAYMDGQTGAVFAETVVITESGPEVLHMTERRIQRAG